jgi:UDP-3-O-[3-hydroxymyristoyl] N-acetylglucosamine deacetylase
LENVIVYNDEKWLTALRYKDELVRHKILDVIGDLRLAGCIRGHIVAAKSSHALNTRLAAKIAGFADEK